MSVFQFHQKIEDGPWVVVASGGRVSGRVAVAQLQGVQSRGPVQLGDSNDLRANPPIQRLGTGQRILLFSIGVFMYR